LHYDQIRAQQQDESGKDFFKKKTKTKKRAGEKNTIFKKSSTTPRQRYETTKTLLASGPHTAGCQCQTVILLYLFIKFLFEKTENAKI
jgi:hypothetical protein